MVGLFSEVKPKLSLPICMIRRENWSVRLPDHGVWTGRGEGGGSYLTSATAARAFCRRVSGP